MSTVDYYCCFAIVYQLQRRFGNGFGTDLVNLLKTENGCKHILAIVDALTK